MRDADGLIKRESTGSKEDAQVLRQPWSGPRISEQSGAQSDHSSTAGKEVKDILGANDAAHTDEGYLDRLEEFEDAA
jgi:hypothetical protein